MAALASNVTGTALVFEGGGMRASVTAGLVTALLAHKVYLDWVAGISAGSSHLCNYVSRDPVRAKASFVEFAADPQMGNWRTFARGQGLFNAEYIYERTSGPDEALPFDWPTFRDNSAAVRIGAFCADDGTAHYFGRDEVPDLESLMARVRASSTMPIVMPPVEIDGKTWLDGALGPSGGIPLDAAEADGYEKFLVVLTQPRDFVKQPIRGARVARTWFRRFPAVPEAMLQRHIHYNATRERIFELERAGKAYVFAPKQVSVKNSTRDVAMLEAAYQDGLAQAHAEMPAIKEFLGLA